MNRAQLADNEETMVFHYEKLARERAWEAIRFAAISIPIVVGLLYLTLSRGNYVATAFVGLIGLVFLFGSAIAIVMAISLFRSGGKWDIRLDADSIRWSSPNENIDASFELRLSDIDHVLVEVETVRPDGSDDIDDYFLVVTDGRAFKLNAVSGVKLDKFVAALESVGVESRRHVGKARVRDDKLELRQGKQRQTG